MSPDSFAVTRERFAGQKKIHLRQNRHRQHPAASKWQRHMSVEQSIYMEQKDGLFDVEVVTPRPSSTIGNRRRNGSRCSKWTLAREREVFENPCLDQTDPVARRPS